jgi:hypothetical protein
VGLRWQPPEHPPNELPRFRPLRPAHVRICVKTRTLIIIGFYDGQSGFTCGYAYLHNDPLFPKSSPMRILIYIQFIPIHESVCLTGRIPNYLKRLNGTCCRRLELPSCHLWVACPNEVGSKRYQTALSNGSDRTKPGQMGNMIGTGSIRAELYTNNSCQCTY